MRAKVQTSINYYTGRCISSRCSQRRIRFSEAQLTYLHYDYSIIKLKRHCKGERVEVEMCKQKKIQRSNIRDLHWILHENILFANNPGEIF